VTPKRTTQVLKKKLTFAEQGKQVPSLLPFRLVSNFRFYSRECHPFDLQLSTGFLLLVFPCSVCKVRSSPDIGVLKGDTFETLLEVFPPFVPALFHQEVTLSPTRPPAPAFTPPPPPLVKVKKNTECYCSVPLLASNT